MQKFNLLFCFCQGIYKSNFGDEIFNQNVPHSTDLGGRIHSDLEQQSLISIYRQLCLL
jgi:hypothetical protein